MLKESMAQDDEEFLADLGIEVDATYVNDKKLKRKLTKQKYHARRMLDPEYKKQHNAKSQEWQKNNEERRKEITKRHYEKHKEKIRVKGREHYYKNKDQRLAYSKQYKLKHIDKYKQYHRIHRYNISAEQFELMNNLQDRKCYLCDGENKFKPLYVDHDKIANKIRKLLCQHCNTGLGFFKDNIEVMLKAIQYLKDHKE